MFFSKNVDTTGTRLISVVFLENTLAQTRWSASNKTWHVVWGTTNATVRPPPFVPLFPTSVHPVVIRKPTPPFVPVNRVAEAGTLCARYNLYGQTRTGVNAIGNSHQKRIFSKGKHRSFLSDTKRKKKNKLEFNKQHHVNILKSVNIPFFIRCATFADKQVSVVFLSNTDYPRV